jgi:hypothetical protein
VESARRRADRRAWVAASADRFHDEASSSDIARRRGHGDGVRALLARCGGTVRARPATVHRTSRASSLQPLRALVAPLLRRLRPSAASPSPPFVLATRSPSIGGASSGYVGPSSLPHLQRALPELRMLPKSSGRPTSPPFVRRRSCTRTRRPARPAVSAQLSPPTPPAQVRRFPPVGPARASLLLPSRSPVHGSLRPFRRPGALFLIAPGRLSKSAVRLC